MSLATSDLQILSNGDTLRVATPGFWILHFFTGSAKIILSGNWGSGIRAFAYMQDPERFPGAVL